MKTDMKDKKPLSREIDRCIYRIAEGDETALEQLYDLTNLFNSTSTLGGPPATLSNALGRDSMDFKSIFARPPLNKVL